MDCRKSLCMNIVTLFIIILGIGALVSVLMFTKTYTQDYLESRRHEREKEMKEKDIQEKMFDDDMDEIDRELEKERND